MTGRKDNVFRNENDYNNLKLACEAYNDDPNDKRTQSEIAKTLNMSQKQFSRYAIEHKNGNFPDSYADALAQGRGMGGSGSVGGTIASSELLVFAENNIDTEDIGRGLESVLFSTFDDQFPGIKCRTIRGNAMRTVRLIIKRLRKERAARAALAAEAPVDDDSSSSSDDDEDFS